MFVNFFLCFLSVCLILGTFFPDRVSVWTQQYGGSIVYARDVVAIVATTICADAGEA